MKKFLLFFVAITFAFSNITFPKLTSRVVDEAGILSTSAKVKLVKLIKNMEKNSSNQLVVVTLKSLQGNSISEYGYQLGRYWGIGQKGKDNGVLLIVAPNERKVRIEVGYGLEGRLTDALSSIIIQNDILPYFKKGDFDSGVIKGVKSIISAIKGSYKRVGKREKKDDFAPLIFFVFIFFVMILGSFVKSNRFIPKTIPSLFIGFFGYVLSGSFILGAILALVLFFVFIYLKAFEGVGSLTNGSNTNDFFIGSGGSSSFGGFDGFSGGGGGFGGGGASGSW